MGTMSDNSNIMGTKKKPTERVSVRLPIDLYEFIERRAKRLHGEDLTAAVIELLSRAHEIVLEEDAIIAQHRFQKWANERARRIAEHIKEADEAEEAGQQEENPDDVSEE